MSGKVISGRGLYLEDLEAGQVFKTGRYRIEAEEIKQFARQFDPQPFHLEEEEGAAESFFGELVASGWHTSAVTMRLLVESGLLAGGLIGSRVELTWPRPVRANDVLQAQGTVMEVAPSRSRPELGKVVVEVDTLNQRDEPVQRMVTTLMALRRPPGEP